MATGELNADNVIRQVYDPPTESLKILGTGGTLVPDQFDEQDFTYVAAGNGQGEIETVVYKLNSVTVATLTFTYDAQNRVTNVVRS